MATYALLIQIGYAITGYHSFADCKDAAEQSGARYDTYVCVRVPADGQVIARSTPSARQ